MAQTSADQNPITRPNDWNTARLAGTITPGIIPPGGVAGFERKTGWDVKTAKGTEGGVTTLNKRPPAKGKITLHLWLPAHFDDWSKFVSLLNTNPVKNQSSAASALKIEYPSLYDVGISQVVVEEIGVLSNNGKGLWAVTISFIEWIPPPPKAITQTTSAAKGGTDTPPGTPPDPIGAEKDAVIGQLGKKAASFGGLFSGFGQ